MENSNLSTEKTFEANVKDLYQAWTTEDALKQWWKPGGRKLKSVEADIKEGGKIKYTFEEIDGSPLIIQGVYKEVKPEEKLVYSWDLSLDKAPVENGEYTLTVEFSQAKGGSKITVHQDKDAEEEGIHPNQRGWEEGLKNLASYLTRSKQQ